MRRAASALLLAMPLLALPAAAAELVRKESPHDVATTLDRLEQAATEAGAKVVARVDHAASAAEAGMELRPSSVVIFGNPKAGTPLMQEAQTLALDLPMRVAAYEDADGTVHVIYHDMEALAAAHGLEDGESVGKVAGALERLTEHAIAEE